MRDALRKTKPNCFEDIIALVSLYRPGPMDNIPVYAKRKDGLEEPDYMHPILAPYLTETYGIMIYQEQVMQAAQALAQAQGISSDEAKAKVQDYQRKYEQSVADAKAKAAQAAETAARVASRGALVAFFALVLGALAAALAGRFGGARSRNDTSDAWAKR